jgi:hypothetical protein
VPREHSNSAYGRTQLQFARILLGLERLFGKGAALADRTKLYSMGETTGIFTLASRWA